MGVVPWRSLWGDQPLFTLVGEWLWMWMVVRMALAQKDHGSVEEKSMALAISTTVWLKCSATPLYCGVYGGDGMCLMPSFQRNAWAAPLVYSLLLSDCSAHMWVEGGVDAM